MTTYYDASTGLEFNTTLSNLDFPTGNNFYDDDHYYNPRFYDNADDKMSRRYPEFTSELSYTPLYSDTCLSNNSLYQEELPRTSQYRPTYGLNSKIPSRYSSSNEMSSYISRDQYIELPKRQPIIDPLLSLRRPALYTAPSALYSDIQSSLSSRVPSSRLGISKSPSPSLQSEPNTVDDKPNETELYTDKLCSIFSGGPTSGIPSQPSLIHTGIYVGSTSNAENLSILKSLGITYVINCGAESLSSMKERQIKDLYNSPKSTVRGYDNIPMQNNDTFVIENWLRHSNELIDRSKRFSHGSTLICSSDVSRSGAVAIGYLLKHGVRLLEAARTLKNERHVALCNHSYIRQLVPYARSLSQLEPISEISAHSITRTPKIRRRNDRRSMYRDYLEMISP